MAVPNRRLRSRLRLKGNDDIPPSKALLPSHKLQCFSVACLDMPHLEFGDKIVLPPVRDPLFSRMLCVYSPNLAIQKVLLELQCLKIPTPLLFMARAADQLQESSDLCSRQYCSVQEFSAPDGQVFLPYWLMQSLHLPEGGSVVVTSVVNIPRGIYCRLQPETASFLDLAAEIGPKLLMETAMRKYSVLSVNATIVIEYGNVRYYVRVAELKPAAVVSLCGDVDLEMDFMPPAGSDLKRPSTGKSSASNEIASVQPATQDLSPMAVDKPDNSSLAMGYGRRLRDGGYVESTIVDASVTTAEKAKPLHKIHIGALQKAQQSVRDKQLKPVSIAAVAAAADSTVLAAQLRSAQGSFSTPGYTLGTAQSPECVAPRTDAVGQACASNCRSNSLENEQTSRSDCQPGIQTCKLCLAGVSSINMELHTLRCAKNLAYHKFECSICHENVLRVDESRHHHCPDCPVLCESSELLADHRQQEHTASCKCTFCGTLFTRAKLQDHVDNSRCEHALVPCLLCALAFKKKDMKQHSIMCSSRTERCDGCKTYIKITEFDAHRGECETRNSLQASAASGSNASSKVTNPHSPRRAKASNQVGVECAYCSQGGFGSITAVEHHVMHRCQIAKSFDFFPTASSNQDEAAQPQTVSSDAPSVESTRPLIAQGRMRRKGDTNALHQSTISRVTPPSTTQSRVFFSRRTPPGPSTLFPAPRLPQQPGKLRKPKPRPNPQLRSLPQRSTKVPEGLPAASISEEKSNSGPVDLCISNSGGTLHDFEPPQPRSQTNIRARKHPGRLDKLP